MQGIINSPIKWLKSLSDDRIITPDITFLFLIDPEEAIKRIQGRDDLIPFEKIDFLKKVHENYVKLAKDDRFVILDATKTIEELADICLKHIK
jgi:thymidylate kinase